MKENGRFLRVIKKIFSSLILLLFFSEQMAFAGISRTMNLSSPVTNEITPSMKFRVSGSEALASTDLTALLEWSWQLPEFKEIQKTNPQRARHIQDVGRSLKSLSEGEDNFFILRLAGNKSLKTEEQKQAYKNALRTARGAYEHLSSDEKQTLWLDVIFHDFGFALVDQSFQHEARGVAVAQNIFQREKLNQHFSASILKNVLELIRLHTLIGQVRFGEYTPSDLFDPQDRLSPFFVSFVLHNFFDGVGGIDGKNLMDLKQVEELALYLGGDGETHFRKVRDQFETFRILRFLNQAGDQETTKAFLKRHFSDEELQILRTKVNINTFMLLRDYLTTTAANGSESQLQDALLYVVQFFKLLIHFQKANPQITFFASDLHDLVLKKGKEEVLRLLSLSPLSQIISDVNSNTSMEQVFKDKNYRGIPFDLKSDGSLFFSFQTWFENLGFLEKDSLMPLPPYSQTKVRFFDLVGTVLRTPMQDGMRVLKPGQTDPRLIFQTKQQLAEGKIQVYVTGDVFEDVQAWWLCHFNAQQLSRIVLLSSTGMAAYRFHDGNPVLIWKLSDFLTEDQNRNFDMFMSFASEQFAAAATFFYGPQTSFKQTASKKDSHHEHGYWQNRGEQFWFSAKKNNKLSADEIEPLNTAIENLNRQLDEQNKRLIPLISENTSRRDALLGYMKGRFRLNDFDAFYRMGFEPQFVEIGDYGFDFLAIPWDKAVGLKKLRELDLIEKMLGHEIIWEGESSEILVAGDNMRPGANDDKMAQFFKNSPRVSVGKSQGIRETVLDVTYVDKGRWINGPEALAEMEAVRMQREALLENSIHFKWFVSNQKDVDDQKDSFVKTVFFQENFSPETLKQQLKKEEATTTRGVSIGVIEVNFLKDFSEEAFRKAGLSVYRVKDIGIDVADFAFIFSEEMLKQKGLAGKENQISHFLEIDLLCEQEDAFRALQNVARRINARLNTSVREFLILEAA